MSRAHHLESAAELGTTRVVAGEVSNSAFPNARPLAANGNAPDKASNRSIGKLIARRINVLAGWTTLALLIRLLCLWRLDHVLSPDGVLYLTLAQNLKAGNFSTGFSPYWAPLYPILISLASIFFRDPEFTGRFISVAAGALLVIPVYRLAFKWYGMPAARIAAAIVALHPLLIYYSTVVLTESVYTLVFTCAVVTGWSALSRGRRGSFLLTGFTFGLCYLLKPEAALFLPLLVAIVFIRPFFHRAYSLKLGAQNGLLLAMGFLLPAAPYIIYLQRQTGAWVLSGKTAVHLWQGSRRAGGDFAQAVAPLVPDATTAIVQLTKALRFEYEIFNLIFPPTFVILAALGLFRQSWIRDRAKQEMYLLLFIVTTLAGYAVTLPNIRFLVPLLPLLLCWVAKGIVEFESWAGGTFHKRESPMRGSQTANPPWRFPSAAISLVVAALVLSLIPLSVYLIRGDKWNDYYGQKQAAVWIKTQDASAGLVVMSTVPVAAFYSGARFVPLVDEDYELFRQRAQREGVSHIVVNQRDFRYMSLLGPLLNEQELHPGLRLDYRLAEDAEHKVLVYTMIDRRQGVTQSGGSR